jgi:hypothetical protein
MKTPGTVDTCSACGAEIVWLRNVRTGNIAPITNYTVSEGYGNIERCDDKHYRIVPPSARVGKVLRINHFADCPDAGKFKRNA